MQKWRQNHKFIVFCVDYFLVNLKKKKWPQNHVLMLFSGFYKLKLCTSGRKLN